MEQRIEELEELLTTTDDEQLRADLETEISNDRFILESLDKFENMEDEIIPAMEKRIEEEIYQVEKINGIPVRGRL